MFIVCVIFSVLAVALISYYIIAGIRMGRKIDKLDRRFLSQFSGEDLVRQTKYVNLRRRGGGRKPL